MKEIQIIYLIFSILNSDNHDRQITDNRVFLNDMWGSILSRGDCLQYMHIWNTRIFLAYLAISPSLWWDEDLYVNKTESYIECKKYKKKIAITVGSLEGSDIGRSVRDGFKYIEILGEDHNYVPYKVLYEGLQLLYSDWQMPRDLLEGGLEAIKTFYKKLSKEYGYTIDVPEAAYSSLANYVYNHVSTEAAVEISKLYVNAYPESSFAYYRLGRFNHLMGNLKRQK